MPSLGIGADLDSLVGKNRSDTAFAAVDSVDEFLAVLDQPATFSNGFCGHVSGNQLVHRRESSEFDRVVFVSFPLHVFKQPGIFVSATDGDWDFHFTAQVTDPAAWTHASTTTKSAW